MTNQDKIVSSMDSRELRLKVFGVGGAGCNAVEHFAHSEFAGVEFAAVNTDVQALLDLSVGCVVPLARRSRAASEPVVIRKSAGPRRKRTRKSYASCARAPKWS